MSHLAIDPFARKQPWKYRGKDPATGRNLCFCGCGRPVGPKRHSSHSMECVKWWRSHSDANHIRWKVQERDKGVCAICGADTERLKADWHKALEAFWAEKIKGYGEEYRKRWYGGNVWWGHVVNVARGDADCPRPPEGFPWEDRRWWEADHIIPVVEGGGGCDHTGYRTLCIPCHKRETAALAARRATARRRAKQPELHL